MSSTRTFLEVQNEALGDDFDPTKYRAQVKQWINEAIGKVGRRVRLLSTLEDTATVTTVAGTDTYPIASNVIRVLSLRDTELARPLADVGIDQVDGELPAGRGRPSEFAIYGGELTLRPVPDGVYSLEQRYEREATTLVADGDTLPVADAYAHLPADYARSKLYAKEDDPDMAVFWMNQFNAELMEMRADVGRQDRGRVRQIPGTFARPSALPRFTEP